jgi:Protein of unknown function (DUF2934)
VEIAFGTSEHRCARVAVVAIANSLEKRDERRRSDATRTAPRHDGRHPTPVNREQIAHRAYELFCARGCQVGRDVEDRLRAEDELRRPQNVIGVAPDAPSVSATDSKRAGIRSELGAGESCTSPAAISDVRRD